MNIRFLILSLVIATIFTASVTETIQTSEGISGTAKRLVYELNVGELQLLTWGIINTESEPIYLEFYATGKGSDLLNYKQFLTIEPHTRMEVEVIAEIPFDYQDNIELHPELFALQRSTSDGKSSGISMNVQMKTTPFIKIGDDPVFTPLAVEEVKIAADEQTAKINTPPPAPKETLEEKLARMQADNEANDPYANVKTDKVYESDTKTDEGFTPEPIEISDDSSDGGGCLIATATYGTEMAPQVQFLRELRDNTLLSTNSGISFMSGFNQVYYSFSPVIADLERESPIFKQAVKLYLTPMLSSLSIMTLAEDGSESQVLGLGISVIALNLAMYIAAPAVVIHRLRK